ncbi:hypothetical protein JKF63_06989 [Porcisia hertigi]|uniref:OPA3-like protein n=1 Tax=Porcisia hertigi TaxID=2761500 RepID=A0A836LFH7_9TRYP|nr:hypothetical protein JKF63_06989 [Porcisia hertigi]
MVGLPAFKFIFLAIRQVTRPVTKQIVSRANTKRGLTYGVCIGLGRVSLGLSGVISEWTRVEEQKQREAKRKSEENNNNATAAKKTLDTRANITRNVTEVAIHGANKASLTEGISEATTTASPTGKPVATPATVAPRSRSLLQCVVYGPQPQGGVADTYDSTVFLDPSRTVGEAARVFIRYPTRSAWDVLRQTFLAPFPEDRLVAAGADLLIELVAYTVLCTLLVVELLQQSRTSAAKEAHLQARLEAIESKVNELVEHSNRAASLPPVQELPRVPEVHVKGRLSALWGAVAHSVGYIGNGLVGNSRAGDDLTAEEGEQIVQGGRALVPQRRNGSNVAYAPPRDPMVKRSKYDETILVQEELNRLLCEALQVEKKGE